MLIAVTHRLLCRGDFLAQIEQLAAGGIDHIILREKDLPADDFLALAAGCSAICKPYGVPFSVNTDIKTAAALRTSQIHLPLPVFQAELQSLGSFASVGVSVHSKEEALFAQTHGASYVIAGHIFDTGCKRGMPGRGLSFLREVTQTLHIPVYAIGGITPENAPSILAAGASGVCVMSGLMQCTHPAQRVQAYKLAMQTPK